MEIPLFLNDQELHQLTGRKARRLQIAALRDMGVPFRVNAANRPVVCRSAVEGMRPAAVAAIDTEWTPRVLRHGKKTH